MGTMGKLVLVAMGGLRARQVEGAATPVITCQSLAHRGAALAA